MTGRRTSCEADWIGLLTSAADSLEDWRSLALRGGLENLVLHDLLAWRDARSEPAELHHWRTTTGEEVDLVVEAASTPVGWNGPNEHCGRGDTLATDQRKGVARYAR